MNYYIEYPRSGWHWFLLRAASFLRRCQGIQFHPGSVEWVIKEPDRTKYSYHGSLIHMGCMGFDFYNGPTGSNITDNLSRIDKNPGNVFIFLRNVKSIIPSLYHFGIQNFKLSGEFNSPLNNFVYSGWGVHRNCSFLNNVDIFIKKCQHPVKVCYYEDNFVKESIAIVPEILGIEYNLSDREKDLIYQDSSMSNIKNRNNKEVAVADIGSMYRVGAHSGYKQELSHDAQQYIDYYLSNNCKFELYNRRYLVE